MKNGNYMRISKDAVVANLRHSPGQNMIITLLWREIMIKS